MPLARRRENRSPIFSKQTSKYSFNVCVTHVVSTGLAIAGVALHKNPVAATTFVQPPERIATPDDAQDEVGFTQTGPICIFLVATPFIGIEPCDSRLLRVEVYIANGSKQLCIV